MPGQMASQTRILPCFQGMIIALSGRFSSDLEQRVPGERGSSGRQVTLMMSLTAVCREWCLFQSCSSGCECLVCQRHGCIECRSVGHKERVPLKKVPKAIWMTSLSMRKPKEVTGVTQAPDSLQATESKHKLHKQALYQSQTHRSHALQ